jgi:Fe-S oxidoreductase
LALPLWGTGLTVAPTAGYAEKKGRFAVNATTITIGAIAAAISLLCWASFLSGVSRIVRVVTKGQPAPDRWRPFFPRLKTMLVEFVAHTRMVKFRTVGWAHWLVMFGFLIGFLFWFEAYGQIFDPDFHWPVIGAWNIYIFADEVLGLGTVIGITVLIIIRQLNHPRVPERLSRFGGSVFGAAYFVEAVVLLEGLGMVFVKTFKISADLENPPVWTSFFTHYFAELFDGSSEYWVTAAAIVKLMSGMIWLAVVGKYITWGVAWHRFAAFFNIYFKREDDGGVALGAAKPMMSGGKVLEMETADPDVDAFGAGKIEDFTWKGILDFTTCTECGRCQSQCPAWNTGKPLSPKLLIMSLRDHAYGKAPYLLAGGKKDMGGDEIGLVDKDGNVLSDKLDALPEAARAEAERPMVGAATGGVDGAIIDTETLWSCTTCGACVEQCPVDIEHVDHIIDMRRYQVLIESDFPTELAGLFKNLENKGNPWGQASSARTNWIDEIDLEIPVFGKDTDTFEGFEYLFWVGCAGAYEDRAKKTTKAVAELLDIAAVDFLVLGEGETCTGDSARRAGNEFLFQMLAQQNIEMLNEVFDTAPSQRKKIVVTCAHCFNALGNEYPQVGGQYEVVHHTQLLNRLVRDKRLIPVASLGDSVTYHDPCYLGRHNKVYNAPRELMAASGGVLTEMPRHGERSMCCGAGGARMWMEETIGKRINIDRVDEALGTLDGTPENDGATKKIATGCPFCRVMLTDGTTARTSGTEQEDKIEVIDVAQMLLESVKRGAPEVKRSGRFLGAITSAAAGAGATAAATKEEAPPAAAAPEASAAAPADAKPKVGLGMGGGAKKPGGGAPKPGGAPKTGGGLSMGGGAKKPGAAAAPAADSAPAGDAPATDTPATEAPAAPAKGLAMGGGAKKPGGGLAMGGTAKKPGTAASAPAAPAEQKPAEDSPSPAAATEAPVAEAPVADAPPAPAAPVKGLAMGGGAKRPGAPRSAAPAAPAPQATPASSEPEPEAPAESAEAPSTEAPSAEAPAAEASTAPAAPASDAAVTTEAEPAKAKGFGIAAGKKRPGSH